jgi:excisionase family DNA binding protein
MAKRRPRDELDVMVEALTVQQAADAVRVHPKTIYRAIRLGELQAQTVRGRDPRRSGRGLGYRILRSDLKAWFMGEAAVAPSDREL